MKLDCTCKTCPLVTDRHSVDVGILRCNEHNWHSDKFGCVRHPNWEKIMRDHEAMMALRDEKLDERTVFGAVMAATILK